MKSFSTNVNFDTGLMEKYDEEVVRRLSDLKGIFADSNALDHELLKEDRVVYEVFGKKIPQEPGQLPYAVTVIHPGKIADEYHMTKGHFHTKLDTAEIYIGLKGHGGIIMATIEGEVSYLEMHPGTLVYVAPLWAHRTVNTSNEDFSFLAIYPGDAGHNYGTIEQTGFPKLVVEKDGKPQLAENLKWKDNAKHQITNTK